MTTSKLEVLVELGPQPDKHVLDKTIKQLKSKDGVKEVIFKDGAFMVETTLPSADVLEIIAETSGKRAVLQGFGDTQSAVAMVSSQSCCRHNVLGVIRFQQSALGLVTDGTVDGLTPGLHGLHVHQAGDISQGCTSIGDHFNPHGSTHGGPGDGATARHAGDLGNITADEMGRAKFRILDNVLNVWDIIGRSVAISEKEDDLGRGSSPSSKLDGDSGKPVACGIIARSAGVLQNPKRICACDGVAVWDERDRPLAGRGRRCCPSHEPEHAKPCCKV